MRIYCGRNLAAARWGHRALPLVFMACMAFPAMAGVDLVTSTAYGGVRMDTSGRPIVLSSQSDVSDLATWPVTYRAGETVTAIAPDGGSVALVASAAPSAGGVSFSPTTGGLWRLVNSNGKEVPVGVSWSVYGEAWSLDFTSTAPIKAHTVGDGPDRKARRQDIPPVAYSGDDWHSSLSAAATVTFISPSGVATQLNLTGTGATQFTFRESGLWTIRLVMADGTTREAEVFIPSGFFLIVR